MTLPWLQFELAYNQDPIISAWTPAPPQTSFMIAMIIPISTNRTIAACSQIQVGDIDRQAYCQQAIPRCGTAL
jgi:hypothetical protein